jgi:hypothetical protein
MSERQDSDKHRQAHHTTVATSRNPAKRLLGVRNANFPESHDQNEVC